MKKFWIALALGALAGGVSVFIFAPRSGAATRRKLRRSFEDLGDNLSDAAEYLKDQAEKLGKEAQKLVDASKDQLDDTVDAAQGYAKTASKVVSKKASRLL